MRLHCEQPHHFATGADLICSQLTARTYISGRICFGSREAGLSGRRDRQQDTHCFGSFEGQSTYQW